MHKLNLEKPVSTFLENICAILPLSRPPANRSTIDWYWKKICGIPFLMRNILNLQRAGITSVIIYSNADDDEIYERLCEEKKITIKLTLATNTSEVIKAIKDYPILVVNGGALHTKQSIQSGMSFIDETNNAFIKLPKRETFITTLDQIILENNFSWTQVSGNRYPGINFLPGKKGSHISEPRDFITQNENLLESCGLNNDSFMDKTITRFFSRQFTRLFLQTPLSPNMITILSLFIGLISAFFFLQGTYQNSMIGTGLLLLSAWIDCTDGEVARLKFLESKIGGILDIICDNLVHFSVFFSIGIGLYQSTGRSAFIFIGALAVFGSLISFILLCSSIIDKKKEVAMNTSSLKMKNTLTDNLANRDFIYFLFLMSVIGRIDIFICITALGSNIFAIYLTYSKIKSTLFAS